MRNSRSTPITVPIHGAEGNANPRRTRDGCGWMTLMDDHDLHAGAVLVAGFDGPTLPEPVRAALGAGRLAGVILFRRNIVDVAQVRALGEAVASTGGVRPIVAIDQEGGRVARLRAPVVTLPPARRLGERGDLALTRDLHRALGEELAALGITFDLAPVCDVDSNPANPVIGDRSFGADAGRVATHAAAAIEGLRAGGVLACAKHFPGHGDTSTDSHLELPVLPHDLARLEAVELPPFVAAVRAGVDAVMTAHVRFDALDATVPATLSRAVMTGLWRERIAAGSDAVVVSDDLLMRAVADRWDVERSAPMAVEAGCDLLLVCSDPAAAEAARRSLAERSRADEAFAARLADAAARVRRMRARVTATIAPEAALDALWSRPFRRAVEQRLAAAGPVGDAGHDPTER